MTELAGHNRPEVLEVMRGQFAGITQPMGAVNEMLIRPTEQE